MNKNDLIAKVADMTLLSKLDASRVVGSIFDTIEQALTAGDKIRLVGFGTFSAVKRAASTGRNPRTGEPVHIPASIRPTFKPGKGLKDSVNKR